MKRMGENAIREGAPLATVEDVLVPIYLLHHYRVEATSKSIGGMDYVFALRGDGQTPLGLFARFPQNNDGRWRQYWKPSSPRHFCCRNLC